MKKYFIYGYGAKILKDGEVEVLDKLGSVAKKYAGPNTDYIIGSESYFEEIMEPEDFAILKAFGDRERTECPCCGLVTNTHRPDYRGETITSRYSSCGFCISLPDEDYFVLKDTHKIAEYIMLKSADVNLPMATLECAQVNYTGELDFTGIDILENVYANSNMLTISSDDFEKFRKMNILFFYKEEIDPNSSSTYYVHKCYGRHYHMDVFIPKMTHGIVEILFSKTK